MTTLLIQAAFAGVGFATGIPGAAQVGWTIGGIVAGAFAPATELPPQFGPRLGDLKIQAATYGVTIPRVYGTARIAGNIIWTTDIIETATTTTVEQGGKGGVGSEQQQTTFSYSQSFAVGICEGPIIGIRRVWANGKVIANLSEDATADTLLASQDMTVYLGTESQMPSALQESYEGAGNVPAYRGLAYVEFENLQLGPFGNRTPNLEFEVVTAGSVLDPVTSTPYMLLPSAQVFYGTLEYTLVTSGGQIWVAPITTPSTLRRSLLIDLASQAVVLQKDWSFEAHHMGQTADGMLWVGERNPGPGTIARFHRLESDGTVSFVNTTALSVGGLPLYVASDNTLWQTYNTGGGFAMVHIKDLNFTAHTATVTFPSAPATTFPYTNATGIPGRIYVGIGSNVGTRGWGYYLENESFVTLGSFNLYGATRGVVGSDGNIYMESGNAGADGTLLKYDQDGNLLGSLVLAAATGGTQFLAVVHSSDGFVWVNAGASKIYVVNAATMTLEASGTLDSANSELMLVHNDWNGKVLTTENVAGSRTRISLLSASGQILLDDVLLSDVVQDICLLSGLTAPEIVVDQLEDEIVDGYVISSIGSVRGMIEPLAQAFFFDAVESDDTIKFVMRGGSAAVTIPQADLAAHDSGEAPDPLLVTRREETELPLEANFTYLARENNYQPGTQRERRQTTLSQLKVQTSLAIVMTDDKAQQTVDKMVYSAWQERRLVEFSTGRKYSKYEPTDILGVTVGDTTYRIRAQRKDVGGNGIIRWGGVIEDASVYTQTSTGATMIAPSNEIPLPPETVLELLDIPLLRDVDDDPGFYIAASGGGDDAWRGQQLYQSKTGTYAALSNGLTVAEAVIGAASTALGDCTRTGQFDEGNSVTVVLGSGTLASATRAQVLAGANAAMLGNELIQFRTATLTGTDTYKLTGLLRGRLGTEWATGSHAAGDRFVLLDTNLRTIVQGWAEVGIAYDYKAVTFGRTLAQTDEESFTNTAVRKKPLAPINLIAGRDGNGNWLIRWVRRTRLAAPWRDGVDAPLGEASEAYEVDVMNGSTAVRTITSAVQSATYTAAQEASDFGSPTPGSLTLNVYQVSADYGRGRAATGTFA